MIQIALSSFEVDFREPDRSFIAAESRAAGRFAAIESHVEHQVASGHLHGGAFIRG